MYLFYMLVYKFASFLYVYSQFAVISQCNAGIPSQPTLHYALSQAALLVVIIKTPLLLRVVLTVEMLAITHTNNIYFFFQVRG
jgi:hypothetical protein